MKCACAILYCHLWPVWLYHILPQYIINGTISSFIKSVQCETDCRRQTDVRTEMKKLTIAFHILRKVLTLDKHPCPQRYSKPGSQQSSSLRSNALDRMATGTGIAELSCVFSWNYSHISTARALHLPLQISLGLLYIAGCLHYVGLKLYSDKGKSSYLPSDNVVRALSSMTLNSGRITVPQSLHPRMSFLQYCPHNPCFRSIQHVTHFAINCR